MASKLALCPWRILLLLPELLILVPWQILPEVQKKGAMPQHRIYFYVMHAPKFQNAKTHKINIS